MSASCSKCGSTGSSPACCGQKTESRAKVDRTVLTVRTSDAAKEARVQAKRGKK